LRSAQPIAGAKPKLLDTFHPADPGNEFRAEQPGVRGFVRQSSRGCKLLVSQPPNISTAQVLLNVIGSGDVKAGRDQSRLLSQVTSLVSSELDVLIEETDRLGFSI
jgi:hypothetical protein